MSASQAEALLELASLDSCEARIPTNSDHVAGVVPSWCELVLVTERDGRPHKEYLRRHDGELIIEVLDEVLHPVRPSVENMLWDHIDDVVERLMTGNADDDDRGIAVGLSTAMAILRSPRSDDPDVDSVRDEAMARYEESH